MQPRGRREKSDMKLKSQLQEKKVLAEVSYFTIYNVHFFAQIFEGKIRMHIMGGTNSISI